MSRSRQLSLQRQPPWRKLLHIHQPYPDNYTDSSFLSQLKRNSTVQKHSFWALSFDFTLVSLQVGLLALIKLVFVKMLNHRGEISVEMPLSLSTLGVIAAFIMGTSKLSRSAIFNILKSSLLLTLTILALSPVLKSLSKSTSSDSIWSISFWLGCLNLCLNDYKFDPRQKQRGFLGMNLLIFNVVLLASRLRSNIEVFCFILFSFEMACFVPLLIQQLRTRILQRSPSHIVKFWKGVYGTVIASLHILNCFLIWFGFDGDGSAWLLMSGYLVLNLALVFVSPVYFLTLQKYKDELQGPWDIALADTAT